MADLSAYKPSGSNYDFSKGPKEIFNALGQEGLFDVILNIPQDDADDEWGGTNRIASEVIINQLGQLSLDVLDPLNSGKQGLKNRVALIERVVATGASPENDVITIGAMTLTESGLSFGSTSIPTISTGETTLNVSVGGSVYQLGDETYTLPGVATSLSSKSLNLYGTNNKVFFNTSGTSWKANVASFTVGADISIGGTFSALVDRLTIDYSGNLTTSGTIQSSGSITTTDSIILDGNITFSDTASSKSLLGHSYSASGFAPLGSLSLSTGQLLMTTDQAYFEAAPGVIRIKDNSPSFGDLIIRPKEVTTQSTLNLEASSGLYLISDSADIEIDASGVLKLISNNGILMDAADTMTINSANGLAVRSTDGWASLSGKTGAEIHSDQEESRFVAQTTKASIISDIIDMDATTEILMESPKVQMKGFDGNPLSALVIVEESYAKLAASSIGGTTSATVSTNIIEINSTGNIEMDATSEINMSVSPGSASSVINMDPSSVTISAGASGAGTSTITMVPTSVEIVTRTMSIDASDELYIKNVPTFTSPTGLLPGRIYKDSSGVLKVAP